jgi:hypothetical protein
LHGAEKSWRLIALIDQFTKLTNFVSEATRGVKPTVGPVADPPMKCHFWGDTGCTAAKPGWYGTCVAPRTCFS